MTKAVVGKVVLNIHDDLAHACYADEKLFAAAMNDLIDGDNDTTTAQQILNQLRSENVERFALHERMVRGETAEAETAAMRLANGGKPS